MTTKEQEKNSFMNKWVWGWRSSSDYYKDVKDMVKEEDIKKLDK